MCLICSPPLTTYKLVYYTVSSTNIGLIQPYMFEQTQTPQKKRTEYLYMVAYTLMHKKWGNFISKWLSPTSACTQNWFLRFSVIQTVMQKS